jgi:DNA-directed RNA polymerase III subunit RPC1
VDTAVKTAETGYMSRRLIKSLEDLSCQYDMTVRDAAGNLVQFKFGNDGLDPTNMEGDDGPVDLSRNWTHIQSTVADRTSEALLPSEIMPCLEDLYVQHDFVKKCSVEFGESVISFVQNLINRLSKIRHDFNVLDPRESGMDIDYPSEGIHPHTLPTNLDPNVIAVNNILKITRSQLESFIHLLIYKYHKAKLEYGTAVGALGAQSIGEPGTQMTLKTFHFAGVASMNITLGVPRIKEIISAAKTISTPIITAELENDTDIRAARIVKARLEKCVLGDVTKYIEDVYGPAECHIQIRLDWETVNKLGLELTIEDVRKAIFLTKKLKLKPRVCGPLAVTLLIAQDVHIKGFDTIKISMPDDVLDKADIWSALQRYTRDLPSVIVKVALTRSARTNLRASPRFRERSSVKSKRLLDITISSSKVTVSATS